MRVKVFTDKNLHRHIAAGWSLKALADGKVATLTGKTMEVEVPSDATVAMLKRKLEDLEGWKIEDQNLRSTSNHVLQDSDKLESVGITPTSPSRSLILVLTNLEAHDPQPITAAGSLAMRMPTQTITVTASSQPPDSQPSPITRAHNSPSTALAPSPAHAPRAAPPEACAAAVSTGVGHKLGGTTRPAVAAATAAAAAAERRAAAAAAAELRQASGRPPC